MPKHMSYAERLMEKVSPEPNTGCWLWQGADTGAGYGAMRYMNKRQDAHRVAWQIFRGPIPNGKFVLHRCDVKYCVNPDHLFLGTQQDNMTDMERKGRKQDYNKRQIIYARGEENGRSKLTAMQVIAIRGDHRRHKIIGHEYGISEDYVWKIQNRKKWRHI